MQAGDRENQSDRELLETLGHKAGEIAMSYFGEDPQVWWKEGDSPVSQADFAVDNFLKEELLKARPDYGWLSEETEDNDERLKARRVFVVDPIDGTRGFINGMKRWCVSMAVVENNRPVVGVLVAPVIGQTLSAVKGEGVTLNGKPTQTRPPASPLCMTGPRAFLTAADTIFDRPIEKTKFIPSLAWRLAMVAMGEIDVALARGSARDWDLAAADIIVHEAGARLTDMKAEKLTYNCPSTRQGSLVTSNAIHHDEMLDLARRAINKQRQNKS